MLLLVVVVVVVLLLLLLLSREKVKVSSKASRTDRNQAVVLLS